MSLRLSDYDYELPESQIARYPPERREQSRLLVVDRASHSYADKSFPDLLSYLHRGDCLVINQTRVIPARLFGTRASTGARIQIFLHQRMTGAAEKWKVLSRPARKAKIGETILFEGLTCEVIEDGQDGEKIVEFDLTGEKFWQALDAIGQIPLPPYFHREPETADKERYQTVFASVPGAVAAPTAGLHITPEFLQAAESKGVKIARITLHTGLGTFRPVESEDITEHVMHEEFYEVDETAARMINASKQAGRKVVAVGTTSVRTLETLAREDGSINAGNGMSGIYIYPPYTIKVADAIVTNFHMPKSTLLMMISAFAGREFLLECYQHAIRSGYRFFSYGDAMLLL